VRFAVQRSETHGGFDGVGDDLDPALIEEARQAPVQPIARNGWPPPSCSTGRGCFCASSSRRFRAGPTGFPLSGEIVPDRLVSRFDDGVAKTDRIQEMMTAVSKQVQPCDPVIMPFLIRSGILP
jgi:hypothetical protein